MADADAVAGPPERAGDLTAFQQTILAVLAEEARYGLALKLEKSKLDDRTNEYTLTDAGHETLLEHLDWLVSKYVTDESRATTLHDRLDTQL